MSKTVFAFGRMNPPTVGHEKLASKVESEAKRRGAMPHIYLSHTQNAKKDPLPYNTKIAIAKKAFGKAVTKSSAKNVIQIMQDLERMGHTEVVMVAGSDRVPEFKSLLGKYNGKEYNFKKIEVVSAGERDPDAQGVEGMSASKLRAIAQSGDYETFAKGMPSKLRDADKKKVYNTIRSVMEDYGDIDESALSALRVATSAHKGQKRKSGDDYISHPKEVARIVKQYKKSHNLNALIQAAYLHDTIEDTDTTYKDLVKQFGGLVAGMVKDLTSDKEAIEAMGKGEYIADKMVKMSSWSLVIKLADRLANVGDIDDRPANFQKKYANQTKMALDRLKKDRYLSKTHKKIIAAIEDKIKEYVTEDVDPTDKELDEILDQIEEDEDLFWEWDEDEVELEEMRKPLTLAQRMKKRIIMRRLAPVIARKRKIKMRRKADKEQLKKRARKAAILLLKKKVAGAKGADYKSLSPSEKIGIDKLVQKRLPMVNNIARKLMPKIIKKETERMKSLRSGKVNESFEYLIEKQKVAQDPDVDERPGTQPKKYFAGVRKKSKEARARHFEKGTKMDDDNPAAYTPAPGDAGAKTKPSKHTKKFKQMYGEEVINEGVNDPAIFKAVFLAGGPGSGKSFIVGKTGLVNIGMKLVNSDDEFERRLKNAGLDAGNPDDIYSPQGQALRGKAKKTTANKQDMYIKGRLGLVLDGTGKDYNKIKKVRDQLIRIGYDTAMIFVNTNLETSLERNRKRARSLPDAEVEKMWKGVQDNMGKFQRLFGNDFTIVDNSEGADTPGETTSAYKKMVKFAKQPPKTRAAKNWIANEKSRRGIKEDTNEAFEKIMTGLNEALEVEVDEGKVDFETDKDLPNLRRPKRTTDYEFKRFLMKTAKNKEKDSVRFGTSRGRDYSTHIGFRGEDVSESALLDTKVVKTIPAPKRGGEIVIRKHNKENKFFVRLKYTGKSAKGSRPENLGTFSSLDDAMKKIKKMNIISEADPCWSGYKQVGMKKNAAGRNVPNCVPEAVSPAQQAAIAIAKKKSGKYDKEGKRIDEAPRVPRKKGQPAGSDKHSDLYTDENPKGTIHGLKFATEKDAEASVAKIKSSDRSHAHKIQAAIAMEQRARVAGKKAAAGVYRSYINDMKKKTKEMKEGADILQSPRPGIRIVIRKHTDGKRFVFRPMTQGTPGEVKILDKKTAEKQISALKRMGWKKAANEEGGAGEEGTYELVRKYKKDTPMQENEIANATKERHNDEKERLKRKHDRELDRARLRDTRNKNMDEEFESLFEEPCCDDCAEDEYGWTEETDFVVIDEAAAEYQGRKVKLNNPTRSDNPKKKTMVYVKNDKGNVVKVYFGDPNLSIKRDDPGRRKNFRARHNCDNPGPKWKARYWSCKFWSTKKVSDLMKG